MSSVLAGVIAYIVVQFAIGAFVSRNIKTETDYINAGRRIGTVIGAFTVFATWFGAEVVVGTSGAVYEAGLSGAQFDPFGYALSLFIAGVVFAAALWRQGLTTFADFFARRFGTATERVVVFMLVPGSVFWAAAQIRAFGQIVSGVSEIDATVAITIAAIVVCAYTVLGGLMADAITDLVQGIAVIFGLVLLVWLVSSSLGGIEASLAAVPRDRLVLTPVSTTPPLEILEKWLVPICGTVVAIELISRILGCRSAKVASRATIAGAGLYLIVGLLPVYLGLVGPMVLPGLEGDALEQVVPLLAERFLPGALHIIFAGALISAILSTVDSTLVAAASLLSHNLFIPALSISESRARLLSVRLTVVALATLAYGLAMNAGSVRDLVETAAAFGSSGVMVCLVIGLFTRIGSAPSALAALFTGSGVWIVATITGWSTTPYTLALAAALLAYAAGLPFSARWPHPAHEGKAG
ncbi:MAG: sodium:solute symporter family protein [Hyphomicrobiaceae bacterium]|nr:sodium:solute symporter family protein [Hyphomicrobiaceae bacterium]